MAEEIIGSGLESFLHRQAQESAMNRTAEAEEEADRILDEAKVEADRIRSQIEERTQRQIVEKRRRMLAQAHLRAKQSWISRREELLQDVWQQAEEKLRKAADEAERLAALGRLIDDAARQLTGKSLEIETNQADHSLFDTQVLKDIRQHLKDEYEIDDLKLAEDSASIWGGVIVLCADTKEIVNNSFDERLALAKRMLRNRIYETLTAQGE